MQFKPTEEDRFLFFKSFLITAIVLLAAYFGVLGVRFLSAL